LVQVALQELLTLAVLQLAQMVALLGCTLLLLLVADTVAHTLEMDQEELAVQVVALRLAALQEQDFLDKEILEEVEMAVTVAVVVAQVALVETQQPLL
jgi:hypothetical protein